MAGQKRDLNRTLLALVVAAGLHVVAYLAANSAPLRFFDWAAEQRHDGVMHKSPGKIHNPDQSRSNVGCDIALHRLMIWISCPFSAIATREGSKSAIDQQVLKKCLRWLSMIWQK